MGAIETLTDVSELIRKQQEIESLRKTLCLEDGYHGILGKSSVMERLYELIDSVAPSDAPVLIQGQSGTGKELVARAIHEAGNRRKGPFVKVNCAALNESLLESELFGHVKGAYTGADKDRIGRFEAAHGGTIFLDEIGDIPLSTQVKLLRVLEEKEIERVGDHKPVGVDVRVVSATHRNLDERVAAGYFREDLYFRINVFPLYIPSLAERREDIPIIVQNFIERNAEKGGKKILGLTSEAMKLLLDHPWPGNVRELRNTIEYAFVLCSGGSIDVVHMPPKIASPGGNAMSFGAPNANYPSEQAELLAVLRRVGWNQSEAARVLGVSRVTVWKRMKKYGIRLPNDL
jgi:DNA-binding NtrC family response regulator